VTIGYLILLLCAESSFIAVAATWQEQRQFVYEAVRALQDHSVVARIENELSKLVVRMPDLHGKLLLRSVNFESRFVFFGMGCQEGTFPEI
jgi:hypothetical protein